MLWDILPLLYIYDKRLAETEAGGGGGTNYLPIKRRGKLKPGNGIKFKSPGAGS